MSKTFYDMTTHEQKEYLKSNREAMRLETQTCLDGKAKVGDNNAVFLGHQPRIHDVALCDPNSWYKTADEALKAGNANLDQFLAN